MRTAPFRLLLLLGCLLASPARGAEPAATPLSLAVRGKTVSALLLRPADARVLLVLAHGQVMDLRHPFMEAISAALAARGVATLRFNFPYAEAKRARPDPAPLMIEALLAAVREAEQRRGALPLLVGGKSLGALMAAKAAGEGKLGDAQGLVILTLPLHAPGRPSAVNARALDGVAQPVLFVQGTLDPLADVGLMRGLVEKLGPSARLHLVQEADHAFAVPESSGRTQAEVHEEVASAVADFAATLGPRGG
jgi:predicted alpha/beta-hydrolase family hydrolase